MPPLIQERLGVPAFELCGDEVPSLYLSIARSHNVHYLPSRATRVASAFEPSSDQ